MVEIQKWKRVKMLKHSKVCSFKMVEKVRNIAIWRIFLGHPILIMDSLWLLFIIVRNNDSSRLCILGSDLMPVCTAMTWTYASVRWWIHAKCCRSAMPALNGYWSGWLTCASCLSTFLTPFCTPTVFLPLQMWYLTSSLPSTRGQSVPSQLGRSQIYLNYNVENTQITQQTL